jgi:hypothetical protein
MHQLPFSMEVRHGSLNDAKRIDPNIPYANVSGKGDGLLEVRRFQIGYLDTLRLIQMLHFSLRSQKPVAVLRWSPAMAQRNVRPFRAFLAGLDKAYISAVAELQVE